MYFKYNYFSIIRGEPMKKKKKTDPRRDQLMRERLRKKLKKLERVPPELIPIEDFIIPIKCMDETRYSSLCLIFVRQNKCHDLFVMQI